MEPNDYERKGGGSAACPSCAGLFEIQRTDGCFDEEGCGSEQEFYTEDDLLEELNFDSE